MERKTKYDRGTNLYKKKATYILFYVTYIKKKRCT